MTDRAVYLRQYYLKNKEKLSAYHKKYAAEHKEKLGQYFQTYSKDHSAELAAYHVAYRQKNKQEIKDRQRNYQESHKPITNARRTRRFVCECGAEIAHGNKARHRKTTKHISRMKSKTSPS